MVTVLKPTTHLICVVIYTVSTVQRKRRKEIEPDMVTEETDRQLTIQESKDHSNINSERAKHIYWLIVEMDNQTLSIVEDNGFVRLVSALESQYSVPVESTCTMYIWHYFLRGKEGILAEVKNC